MVGQHSAAERLTRTTCQRSSVELPSRFGVGNAVCVRRVSVGSYTKRDNTMTR